MGVCHLTPKCTSSHDPWVFNNLMDCSSHAAKLPHTTSRLLLLKESSVCDSAFWDADNGFKTDTKENTIWHGSGRLPCDWNVTTLSRAGSASPIAIFFNRFVNRMQPLLSQIGLAVRHCLRWDQNTLSLQRYLLLAIWLLVAFPLLRTCPGKPRYGWSLVYALRTLMSFGHVASGAVKIGVTRWSCIRLAQQWAAGHSRRFQLRRVRHDRSDPESQSTQVVFAEGVLEISIQEVCHASLPRGSRGCARAEA